MVRNYRNYSIQRELALALNSVANDEGESPTGFLSDLIRETIIDKFHEYAKKAKTREEMMRLANNLIAGNQVRLSVFDQDHESFIRFDYHPEGSVIASRRDVQVFIHDLSAVACSGGRALLTSLPASIDDPHLSSLKARPKGNGVVFQPHYTNSDHGGPRATFAKNNVALVCTAFEFAARAALMDQKEPRDGDE